MQPRAAHSGRQPQLHIDDEAEASVECHSSKPAWPGLLDGHFCSAKLGFFSEASSQGLGKKFPRCLETRQESAPIRQKTQGAACHLPMCIVE